nr:MAG TPA: hypothetical protein [Caudoviricetes sp.]
MCCNWAALLSPIFYECPCHTGWAIKQRKPARYCRAGSRLVTPYCYYCNDRLYDRNGDTDLFGFAHAITALEVR